MIEKREKGWCRSIWTSKKKEDSREIEKIEKDWWGSVKRKNVLEREKGLDVEEERRFHRKIEKIEKRNKEIKV